MSDVAIRVEHLSKLYMIGVARRRHSTLRDLVADRVAAWFRWSDERRGETGRLWALRDVSLEVKQGEVVGIIGKNGAGKSTLLKVLSRITEPTEGEAQIFGQVGSLLEVGIGFHPELTGRENVYLNGAILGMTRVEIGRRFDAIVAFAELEKFIDTPVKRYSSGMYMRLGFAVAAHLEPDILIVDEVLAVGDTEFQNKCLGKIGDVARTGRTVLFVSHNMPSVQHLCSRVVLFEAGRIAEMGRPGDVIAKYLSGAPTATSVSIAEWPDRVTSGEARLVRFEVADGSGKAVTGIPIGGTICFTFHADFYEPVLDPCFGVAVQNALGESVLDIRSLHDGLRLGRTTGRMVVQARVRSVGLYPGRYFLSPWITDAASSRAIDWARSCATLQVYPAPGPHGDLKLDPAWGKYWVPSDWARDGLPPYG